MKRQVHSLWKMTRRTLLACLLLLAFWQPATAQTALTYGDIAITGWNNNTVSSNRQLQVVLLKACTPGTVFKITAGGFNNSGTANSSSNGRVTGGVSRWTNSTGSTLPVGTVITISSGGSLTCDIGTMSSVPSACGCGSSGSAFLQSTSGGRFFLYYGGTSDGTGSDYSNSTTTATFNGTPIQLFGFQGSQSGYTNWLSTGTTGNFQTYRASDLASYSIFHAGNAVGGYFTGGRSSYSTTSALLAALQNTSNWTVTTGSGTVTIPSGNFTITAVPSFTGSATVTVCENSSANSINTNLAINDATASGAATETWSVLLSPSHGSVSGFPATASSTGGTVAPSGLTYTPTSGYNGSDTLIVRVSNGTNSDTQYIHIDVTSFHVGTVTLTTNPICVTAGTLVSTSGSTSGGTWSSSNSSIATTNPSSGTTFGRVAGTATVSYNLTVSGCGTISATSTSLTVRPLSDTGTVSPGTVSTAAAVCTGNTTTFSSTTATTTAAGYTNQWTSSNPAIASINVSTGVALGRTAGSVTISFTVAGCGTWRAFRTLNVNTTPTGGTITGGSSVCTGSTLALSTSGTSGGSWTSTAPSVASVDASSGTVYGLSAGSATISYTVTSASCGSSTATQSVAVNASGTVGSISGASSVCTGASTSLSTSGSGGSWSTSNASIASVNSSGTVFGVGAGSATISYIVTGCGAGSTTQAMTVNTTGSAGTISGASSVCTGATTSLSTSGSGGSWSTSNASIASVNSSGTVFGVGAGSATISYIVTGCGAGSTTQAMTVNTTGSAGTISGATSTCAMVGSTTLSVSGASGSGTWSSTAPTIASVTTGGTVIGLSAGSATISYTVTNGCGTVASTSPMTVNPGPTSGTISGATSVCEAANTTLSVSGASGSGTWSSGSTVIATVSTGGVVYGVLSGSATISYTVTNGCGTATSTSTMAVNPLPNSGTAGGATSVCYPTSTTVTISGASGSGSWTSAAPGIASVSSGGFVTAVSVGSTTLTYTVTNSCGTARTTTPMTVNASGSAGTITGTSSVCIGATRSWTTSGSGGTWSSTNPSIASVDASGTVYGVAVGSVTISYIVTGCGAGFTTLPMTVNPTVSAGTISGPSFVCTGGTTSLSTSGSSGGTWSTSGVSIASVDNSSGTVYGVAVGSVTISYSVTGCGAGTTTRSISVFTAPTATISGTTPLCSGTSDVYFVSTGVSGGTWSSSATSTATVNSSTGSVYGVAAGTATISYIISNSCGADTASQGVTIITAPSAGTVTGTTPLCTGASATYTSSGTSGGTWSSSATGVATVSPGGSVTGVSAGSANITYSVSNSCGTNTASQAITVNATPSAGTISGASSVCEAANTTLSTSGSGGSWTSSATSTASVNSSTGVVRGVVAGSATISYSVTNSCGTDVATSSMTVNPLPDAGSLSGASTVCVAASTTLTSSGSGGGTWSSSNTARATVSASGDVTGVSAGSVTISYSVTNSCGTDVATQSMTVNPLPNAGTISGASSVCEAANTTLSTSGSGGSWTSSATSTASVNSSTGVVRGVVAGSATISYSVTNSCGTDVATSSMTVNPLPNAGSISGVALMCETGAVTMSTSGTGGGTWSSSDGGSIASISVRSATAADIYGVGHGSITISYSVTNSCGTDVATHSTTILPLPNAGSISGASSVCVSANTTLTSSGDAGGTWGSSATGTATVTSSGGVVYGVAAGSATITYSVASSCGIDRTTASMTVNPTTSAGTISGASSVCVYATTTLSSSGSGGSWSSSNTGRATVDASTGDVTGVSVGSVTISYSVSGTCGTGVATQSMTVNPLPNAGTITGPSSVCETSSITLSDGVSGGTWSTSAASTASVTTSGVVSGVAAGSATISYAITNSCGTDYATRSITVNPLPATPASITGSTTISFTGGTTTLSSTTGGGTWSSSNTAILTVSGSGVVTAVAAGTATITYTVSNSCGSAYTTASVTCSSTNHAPTFTVGGTVLANVCANSPNFSVNTQLTFRDLDAGQPITISVVSGPAHGTAIISYTTTSTGGTIIPSGLFFRPSPTDLGMDSVTVRVSDGIASSTVILRLNVVAIPDTPVVTGVAPVCTGSTITLVGSPAGGFWGSMDGNSTTGSTTGVFRAISGSASTVYYNGPYNTSGCRTQVRVTVPIIGVPLLPTVSGSSVVCPGSSTTLSASTGGGTWSSSNSSIASVTSGGSVTGVTTGAFTISYVMSNACGSATATKNMTTSGTTTLGPISGGTYLCMGATLALTNSTSGGTWSTTNTSLAVISSGGLVSAVAPGVDTAIYSYTNVCGLVSSVIKRFTVYPAAVIPVITGPSVVVRGTSAIFTSSQGGGAWSSSSPSIATVTPYGGVSTYGQVTGVAVGSDTIRYTVNSVCGTLTGIKVISITSSRANNNGGAATSADITLNMFPNPTSGTVAIEVIGSTLATEAIVTDLTGKVIVSGSNNDNKLNLDLGKLAAGTYLIKVTNGDHTFNEKVIVE